MSWPVQVIPVLDVLGGQVVRGIAGRRHEYRPWISPLAQSAEPLAVAAAFQQKFGLTHLYIADLDAIAGQPPALALYAALRATGSTLWVDAGMRRASDARPLLELGVHGIIAGLETLTAPEELRDLITEAGPEHVIFSLDLRGGQPLLGSRSWPDPEPPGLVATAVGYGVLHVIVLDLTRVGVGAGVGTEALCRALTGAHTELEVYAGGGVRSAEDLQRLAACGVSGVLVASALHDGRLSRS